MSAYHMKTSHHRNMSRRDFVRHTTAAMAAASACRVSEVSAEGKVQGAWAMKLATSSVMFGELPFEKVCAAAARLRLQAIDIWAPFSWGGSQCTHLEDVKNRLGGAGLRELLAKHKLALAAFSIYGNKLSQYSKLIGDFGGGIVVRSAGAGKLADPKQLTARMRAFFESLKPDVELAEECDARLAIENHGGGLLSSPDSFKAFVELNPNPKRIGVAVAPYHLQSYETLVEEVIKIAGSQCLFFYAWQRGSGAAQLPGVGPVDFTPWLGALADMNYPHSCSIFMHGHPKEGEMEVAISKSRDYLLKCRA